MDNMFYKGYDIPVTHPECGAYYVIRRHSPRPVKINLIEPTVDILAHYSFFDSYGRKNTNEVLFFKCEEEFLDDRIPEFVEKYNKAVADAVDFCKIKNDELRSNLRW